MIQGNVSRFSRDVASVTLAPAAAFAAAFSLFLTRLAQATGPLAGAQAPELALSDPLICNYEAGGNHSYACPAAFFCAEQNLHRATPSLSFSGLTALSHTSWSCMRV